METWEIIVKGKVQGVWYRASTRERALQLGIKGWVRNESNGSVYMLVQGEQQKLERLEAWCYEGPQFAKVTEVKAFRVNTKETFSDFEIIR